MAQANAWHDKLMARSKVTSPVPDLTDELQLRETEALFGFNRFTEPKKKKRKVTKHAAPLPTATDDDWLELFQELHQLVIQLKYKPGYVYFKLEEAMPPRNVWKWWAELTNASDNWHLAQPSRSRGSEQRFQELEDHLKQLRGRLSYRLRNSKES